MVHRVLTNKNKNKMKKYFVVETDEICEFGDVLNLTMFKELEDGKITVEKEIEFNENTMNWMIEMGFVQEREVEEYDLIDFEDCDNCVYGKMLNDLIEGQEDAEKRLDNLEAKVKNLEDYVAAISMNRATEKKNAQPKKR